MSSNIISTAVTFIVSGILGWLVSSVKGYKHQKEALKCLLRSNITSKYYVYKKIGNIPEYEKENINYMAEEYFAMGGNSYVRQIVKEINEMEISNE